MQRHVRATFNIVQVYRKFVEIACHWRVLDGFDQHFQATVHFPISSAIDEPQQQRQLLSGKFRERWESNPGWLGPEASMLTIAPCCPLFVLLV